MGCIRSVWVGSTSTYLGLGVRWPWSLSSSTCPPRTCSPQGSGRQLQSLIHNLLSISKHQSVDGGRWKCLVYSQPYGLGCQRTFGPCFLSSSQPWTWLWMPSGNIGVKCCCEFRSGFWEGVKKVIFLCPHCFVTPSLNTLRLVPLRSVLCMCMYVFM